LVERPLEENAPSHVPVPSWIAIESGDASSPQVAPLRIVRLTHVDPLLPSHPNLLFDFTLPDLTERTRAILRGQLRRDTGPYRGYRFGGTQTRSLEEEFLPPFEAARLVGVVYARCLDPVHIRAVGRTGPSRDDVLHVFARMLATPKVIMAVELVAQRLDTVRWLDRFQPDLGTTTIRWMQYLAGLALEALRSITMPYPEYRRLRDALCGIVTSVTAVDRYTALARRPIE
jgi:hypothetical protein